MRNLIQNAVDFADDTVWVKCHWTDDTISIRIMDDGAGFPPLLLGRIGDPFLRLRRGSSSDNRRSPEYEGMGLGLFIAKTLLERTSAEVTFANGTDPFAYSDEDTEHVGAIVEVTWPRDAIDARSGRNAVERGENKPILV